MVNAIQFDTGPASPPTFRIAELPFPAARLDRDHCVLETNAAMAVALGKSGDDLIGKPLSVVIETIATAQANGAYRLETRADAAWLRLDIKPSGKEWLALLVDVSAEVRAYEQLKYDFLTRDRLLLDAEIGTWRYHPDTETYFFSDELALGYEGIAKPVPLETLQSIQHRDDRDIDTAIRDRLTSEGGAGEAEMRYRDGQGGWRHLRALYRSGQQLPSGASRCSA